MTIGSGNKQEGCYSVVQARRWTTFFQFVLTTTNDFSKILSKVRLDTPTLKIPTPSLELKHTRHWDIEWVWTNYLYLSIVGDHNDTGIEMTLKTQTEFGNQMSSLLEKILWCLYTYFQFFPCSGWPKKLVFFHFISFVF